MLVIAGWFLILMGMISTISSLVYAYKKFKKNDSNPIRNIFGVFINILDIFSALDNPKSFVSFILAFSLGAIIIGFKLI
jgi:uncharacterized membrane protein YczE